MADIFGGHTAQRRDVGDDTEYSRVVRINGGSYLKGDVWRDETRRRRVTFFTVDERKRPRKYTRYQRPEARPGVPVVI